MKIIKISMLVLLFLILFTIGAGIIGFSIASAPTTGNSISKYQQPQKALLVVDIQEDYTGIHAHPPFPIKHSAEMIKTVNKVIACAKQSGMIIAYIGQEWPDNGFCRAITGSRGIHGQPGAAQDRRLTVVNTNYFSKSRSDAFSNSKLESFLIDQRIDEVYIVGIDAVFCVYATARGAVNRGYKVTIIPDATLTQTDKTAETIKAMYKKHGITTLPSKEFNWKLEIGEICN